MPIGCIRFFDTINRRLIDRYMVDRYCNSGKRYSKTNEENRAMKRLSWLFGCSR